MSFLSQLQETVMQGRSDDIRKYPLSDELIELQRNVEAGRIKTSNQLAKSGNMTPQTAHGKLDKLAKGGYVERVKRMSASGGCEWVYFT